MLLVKKPDFVLATDRRLVKATEMATVRSAEEIIAAAEADAARIREEAKVAFEEEKKRGYDKGIADGKMEIAMQKLDLLDSSVAFMEGVETFLPYELRDREHDRYNREAYFGLCRNDFTPKPAFAAYSAFTAMRPSGSIQKAGVPWHDEGRTLFFPQWRRPDNADAKREGAPLGADAGMAWSVTSPRTMRVQFSTDSMRFFDHLGAEIWPRRVGNGEYDLEVSERPIYFMGGEIRQ